MKKWDSEKEDELDIGRREQSTDFRGVMKRNYSKDDNSVKGRIKKENVEDSLTNRAMTAIGTRQERAIYKDRMKGMGNSTEFDIHYYVKVIFFFFL
jgi:hypothetical protein